MTVLYCDDLDNLSKKIENFEIKNAGTISLDFVIISDLIIQIEGQYNHFGSSLYGISIILKNIQQIQINKNAQILSPIRFNTVEISDTFLDFYYDNISLADACAEFGQEITFPYRIEIFHLYLTESVIYSNALCVSMIRIFSINHLYFYGISPNNLLHFNDSFNNQTMEAKVYHVFFSKSILGLDQKILNRQVFGNIESITLDNSTLLGIENDTFFYTKNLKMISLRIKNFEEFIRKSDNKWLQFLNLQAYKNLDNCKQVFKSKEADLDISSYFLIILEDMSKLYEYTDEDFCLFKHFPHNNAVFPIVYTKEDLNCTCTLLWLLLNWKLKDFLETKASKSELISMNTSSVKYCFENFDKKIGKCNFDEKLINCGLNPIPIAYNFQCNTNEGPEFNCMFKYVQLILCLIICFISFTLNWIGFISLKRTDLKHSMYKYIMMEMFFQAISSMMFVFNCILYDQNGFYDEKSVHKTCVLDFRLESEVFNSIRTFFYDILGSVLASCCWLANFFTTFDRYLFVSSSRKFSWFYTSKKIHKQVSIFIILFGFVLNLHQIFIFLSSLGILRKSFDFTYSYPYFQDIVFVVISLFSFIFNILLINFMRKASKNKKKMTSKNALNNESENREKKILTIVIFQSFLLIVTRIPDIYVIELNKISEISIVTSNDELSLKLHLIFFTSLFYILNFVFCFLMNKKLRESVAVLLKDVFFINKAKDKNKRNPNT